MSDYQWKAVTKSWRTPAGHYYVRLECGHSRRTVLNYPLPQEICKRCTNAQRNSR